MRTLFLLSAFCVAGAALSGCGKAPSDTPVPQTQPGQAERAPTNAGSADTSVPSAGSVLPPAAEAKPDLAAGRTNDTMSRAQESSAMPMPGQNNDHSAPVAPAKRASNP